jgi:hypothetical protein
VISVDAKKKELIGAYKNAGQEWQPTGQPEQVNVYDFIDREAGKVTPYGVYDVTSNTGWVGVGTDHDTAAFAVATIGHWWDQVGRAAYPDATRLLITADGGGSNGYRTPPVEDRTGRPGRPHRPDHHRHPPAPGHQQVEQDRAPAVLGHLHQLARQAPDQPRSHPRDHRGDHHHDRPDRPRRARHRHLPHRRQDPRQRHESPQRLRRPTPPRIPRRVELHAQPTQVRHARHEPS